MHKDAGVDAEPTYTYIKGQGWVVSTVETYTTIIGRWKVTLYNRVPEIGERGLNRVRMNSPIKTEIQGWSEDFLDYSGGIQGWFCDARNYKVVTGGEHGPATQWITVHITRNE